MIKKSEFFYTLITLVVLVLLLFTACSTQPVSPDVTVTAELILSQPTDTDTPEQAETETPEPQATSTSTPAVEIAACTEPLALSVIDDETIAYKHVQFIFDQRLGFNFTVQECLAGFWGDGYGTYYPDHLLFRAQSNLPHNVVQPEIRIFEIPKDPQDYTHPINSDGDLQQVLSERPEPSPWYEGVALHMGEQYLDSHYGIGVRAIVEYIQDPFFWTNRYLQYAYHGLSDDGRYFVMANFPFYAPYLMDIEGSDPLTNTNPNALPLPSWPDNNEQQREIIEEYNQEVVRRFESSSHADYTPDYELYDWLVQSLQIGVQETVTASVDAVCFSAPPQAVPLAFTPDSTGLLLRGNDGVYSVQLDGSQESGFIPAPMNILTAALSPDGGLLAWSLEDNTIQLLRLSDQKVLHTLSGHTDSVTKLRFTPDGSLLVSASHDYSIRVWSLQGEALRFFQPPGGVLGINVSSDGEILATVPFDGPVSLWELDSLEKIKDLGGTGGYDTSDPYFSPDGQFVAADLATGLYLWRVSDGKLIWDESINSMAVAFSPDGRYLAYSDISDGNKLFLSTPDGSEIVYALQGHKGPVWEMVFSPDSQWLASNDGLDIRIWQVADGSLEYIGKEACP